MAGDIKPKFAASVALTVTSLHSLASDAAFLTGWGSASVANSTPYDDFLIGGTFTTHASNRQAGYILVFVIASYNDTPTWFSPASGTIGSEGAVSFTAKEQRNTVATLLHRIAVNNTASQVYGFGQRSIKQLFGRCPTHWALWVAQNCATSTNAGLAAAGSALYYTPVMDQYT